MSEMLVRAAPFSYESRADGDGLTLEGYASVFNAPYEIDSWEGRFTEVVARGAFKKTLQERTPVLQFDHGHHPMLGSIPLGKFTQIREDDHGLFMQARLSGNWLVEPIRDAIADGALTGMSFRFQVPKGKDSWDRKKPVPVRTIHEAILFEAGPVVFPASPHTSVGVRSGVPFGRVLYRADARRRLDLLMAGRKS